MKDFNVAIAMALAATISGCSTSQPTPLTWQSDLSKGPYLTPSGTPLTWTSDLSSKGPYIESPPPSRAEQAAAIIAGIAAESATLAAAGGATHQLAVDGVGIGPEDRVAVFADPPAMERVIAIGNDTEKQTALAALGEQDKLDLLRSFVCFPQAGSPVLLLRESDKVAWIKVTTGDRAGCSGVVPRELLLDAKFLYNLHNPMNPSY